jgi:shikimate kinase
MNIILIGYRGSGKSSVGKLLALRLGWAFVDTDQQIIRRAGKSIAEIFAHAGEAGFRQLESAVVAEAAGTDHTIIAAGGGVVLRAENVAHLKQHGRLVWLQAAPEVLWRRIQADLKTAASRPNLTAAGGLEEIRRLLNLRAPLYAAAADFTVDASSGTVEQLAERVAAWIGDLLSSPATAREKS